MTCAVSSSDKTLLINGVWRGAKRGSMGREGVNFAIREMVQTKTVCMNLGV